MNLKFSALTFSFFLFDQSIRKLLVKTHRRGARYHQFIFVCRSRSLSSLRNQLWIGGEGSKYQCRLRRCESYCLRCCGFGEYRFRLMGFGMISAFGKNDWRRLTVWVVFSTLILLCFRGLKQGPSFQGNFCEAYLCLFYHMNIFVFELIVLFRIRSYES